MDLPFTATSGAPIDKQAGEFGHAIQYLNKIKARYADDPNTYKQFLDILHTYQKEQKHSHDVSLRRYFCFRFRVPFFGPLWQRFPVILDEPGSRSLCGCDDTTHPVTR